MICQSARSGGTEGNPVAASFRGPSGHPAAAATADRQAPIARHRGRQYVLGDPPHPEPDQSRCVEAMAARTNPTPDEFCYDHMTGDRMLVYPVTNYVHDMIEDPDTIPGPGDGGAHRGLI